MAAVAALAVVAGCFSIEKAVVGSTGEEHVLVSNYGWYLFHFLPVACGNASQGAALPSVFFRDDVTLDKVQDRFMRHAQEEGREVLGLSCVSRESVMLELPGFGTTLPIPYLVTYREVQLSGTLAGCPEEAER